MLDGTRTLLQVTVEEAALADEITSRPDGRRRDQPPRVHHDQRPRRPQPRLLMTDARETNLRMTDTNDTPPNEPIQPIALHDEMENSFLDYAMSVIMSRALPDVRDGLKPVHRRIIWDMEEQGFRPDRAAREVRSRHRRHDGPVPPARRQRDLRRPRAHGPAVLAAPPADRLPRQLRQPRLRSGGRALHRVPAAPAGDAAAGGHRRGHRRHDPELRRLDRAAGRAAGSVPEPARQRQPGHRRRHGDQHPAAQPRRGDRRRRPPARQPRGDARRPDGSSSRVPTSRPVPASWARPASSTPTAPVVAA